MSYWRAKARPIVLEVLAETAGKPEAEIKKALHDAYPFGQRAYHPYKIWLDEIRRQRAPKPATGPCVACGHGKGSHQGRYGNPGAKCHAADCACDGYQQHDPRQEALF